MASVEVASLGCVEVASVASVEVASSGSVEVASSGSLEVASSGSVSPLEALEADEFPDTVHIPSVYNTLDPIVAAFDHTLIAPLDLQRQLWGKDESNNEGVARVMHHLNMATKEGHREDNALG